MKPKFLVALIVGGALWALTVDKLVAASPETEEAEASPEPKSAKVVAAKRAYERALRNARLQYIRQLDVALKEVMKVDDLEEADKIGSIRQRMISEHLKDGGDVITVFRMRGTRSWEDSGIRVRRGQTIEVSAPEADINEKKVETINGISAAVGSLLMKVDGKVYDLGKGNEIVSEGDGKVYFRSNLRVSPNHAIEVSIVVK